ncbi:hypothetical protein [Variovorax sp. YR752]|uniref:hypothetical protein n=1 Tax=Variovorax sp. YR752 TaxID=1884383 RepID=UPI0031382D83
MMFPRLVGIAFLTLLAELCQAGPVFGFVQQATTSSKPKAYLAQTPFNMGYVTIKASVDNPQNKGCISPNASNLWRKIFQEESEVFLAARVWGFKGVPSEKWIPIANYKWNNNGQFCNSVFQPDVLLVPLAPILASLDASKPGAMEEPYIRIALRSKTDRSEKLSSAFTTLLKISSAYATGGAATTFTQLLDVTGGPAVELISEHVNEAFRSSSNQDFPLSFKWADLSKGKLEFSFQLSSIDKGMNESVEGALSRMRSNQKPTDVKELIRFQVTVDTRRSVFFADSDIQNDSEAFSVRGDDIATTPYSVLNYPKDTSGGLAGTISSIQQLLSSEAPGLATQLVGKDFPLACRKLMAKIFNAGFNRHDSALIMAAALDESKSDWRTNMEFIRACISDGELLKDISVLRPPVFFVPDTVKDIEQPNGHMPFVARQHEAFLVELRNALISKGFSHTAGLRSAFQGLNSNVTWAGDVPELVSAVPRDASLTGLQSIPLENLPVAAAGCFASYFSSGETPLPFLGMAVLLSDSKGARRPYLLSIKLDPKKLADPVVGNAIVAVWLLDLDLAPNQAIAISNRTYDKSAMCYTSQPRNATTVIEKLKSIKA